MTTSTEFRKSGHLPSLVAGLVHFDVSFMVWVLLGALGAYVAQDLALSPAQKGLMVALPPLGGAAFRLVLGSLAERVGMKATGLTSMALTFVPLAWASLAGGSFAQVLGIGLLLGIAGASFAIALPLVSRWYPPEHQGLALGIAGAGNSGTIIAALAAPRLAEHVGWHAVFGFAAIPVSLAWLAFAVLAKEPPTRPARPARGILSLLEEPDARWLCLFYMATFGGFVGLANYLPIYFTDRFSMTKVAAGGCAALCAVAGSLLRPVGGAVSDRVGGTSVLIGVLATVAAAGVVLATLPALAPTIVLLFATLGSLGIGNGAVFQLVPQRFPDRVGQMTGLVGAAGGVGGFLLPFGLGSLTQLTGGFAMGFAVFALAAASASLIVRSRRRVWRSTWSLEGAL
ncbi:MAG TPA: MFS transporter [Acidimicrobiales bacterium]|nr:MFS transporter [Acidimicrobiales bacterium]